jgi:hypothetical protein
MSDQERKVYFPKAHAAVKRRLNEDAEREMLRR